jgi:Amidase
MAARPDCKCPWAAIPASRVGALANKLLVCHDAGSEFAIRSAKPDTLCEGRYAMPRFDSLSLSSLREAYAAGARPSDLVATIYDRVRDGPIGPAWIHLRPREEALRACAEIEARYVAGQSLPLYGVPFGVKDNIDVAGMPTTAACPAFSYAPERSARSVELLLAAGAVCLGKTNLDQFTITVWGVRGGGQSALCVRRLEFGLRRRCRVGRCLVRARDRHGRLRTHPCRL